MKQLLILSILTLFGFNINAQSNLIFSALSNGSYGSIQFEKKLVGLGKMDLNMQLGLGFNKEPKLCILDNCSESKLLASVPLGLTLSRKWDHLAGNFGIGLSYFSNNEFVVYPTASLRYSAKESNKFFLSGSLQLPIINANKISQPFSYFGLGVGWRL